MMLFADLRAFFIILNIVMDLSCNGKFVSLDLSKVFVSRTYTIRTITDSSATIVY
jgi:hypothetical protein